MIQEEGLHGLLGETRYEQFRKIESTIVEKYTAHKKLVENPSEPFQFPQILDPVNKCFRSIVEDDFTAAFRDNHVIRWNMNVFYFFLWTFGLLIRYVILLPLRVIFFTLTTVFFLGLLLTCFLISKYVFEISEYRVRSILQLYANAWLYTLGFVVVYKGRPPKREPFQVYVANHTTVLDFVLLFANYFISVIGQRHGAILGFFQDVLTPMKNIWFQRFEYSDRRTVRLRIRDHIKDINNPPLMVFPEGVCVNNKYVVMFRKGIFEFEGVKIVPIAIKYDKSWSDPYFSPREATLIHHVFKFMRYWCTYVEVSFLEPQVRKKGESAVLFATRVKKMIAKKANLITVDWDGYLKYFKPKERFVIQRREIFARKLLKHLKYWEEKKKRDEKFGKGGEKFGKGGDEKEEGSEEVKIVKGGRDEKEKVQEEIKVVHPNESIM